MRATVIVTHYEDQRCLDLVLAALEWQLEAPAFEVVVADDGSARIPLTGQRPYPVEVRTHADLGVRSGSVRNLGAAGSDADVLVFLDGDTVPEPQFVSSMVRAAAGGRLVVGRRRHADLARTDVDELRAWLTADGPAPPQLPEPAWLADGYRATEDLRVADQRTYRYLISAVMACSREAFLKVGGFAEELVGYGGEDWEFARRWWLSGRDFAHEPTAIGWHDGPDLGGRAGVLAAVKNRETLTIARLITDPWLRGRGLWWDMPRVVVRWGMPRDAPEGSLVASAESVLGLGDVGLWTGSTHLDIADPRVRARMPGAGVLARAELVIDLERPYVVGAAELADWERRGPVQADGLRAASPRDRALGTAPRSISPPPCAADDLILERWWSSRAGG